MQEGNPFVYGKRGNQPPSFPLSSCKGVFEWLLPGNMIYFGHDSSLLIVMYVMLSFNGYTYTFNLLT